MELLVLRKPATDGAILGELLINGRFTAFTLERQAVAIPLGRYPVRLPQSARAEAGTLWSPDPEHRLPLVEDVPGRSAIRLHAGNTSQQTEGCILVGRGHTVHAITESRSALSEVMGSLDAAEHLEQETWLTVQMAPDSPTKMA